MIIVYGALMSSDPGDIRETMAALIRDRIRVSIVGLAAQVAICEEICAKTNGVGVDGGTGGGTDGSAYYSIALHEQHFRELLLAVTTPPVTRAREQSSASLLMMGFPSRTLAGGNGDTVNYCACHNRPAREGYACTRCGSRVCRLPSECPACGLTLILSTHLARSYHHLFPLRNWVEVSWAEAEARRSRACFACLAPFPEVPPPGDGSRRSGGGGGGGAARERGSIHNKAGKEKGGKANNNSKPDKIKGLSESGRYACEVCRNHFCIDCDLFAHEVLHNCPGCQGDTRGSGGGDDGGGDGADGKATQNGAELTNGKARTNTNADTNGAMEIDPS